MNATLNQENKRLVWDFWDTLEAATGDDIEAVAGNYLHAEVTWRGFDPIHQLRGVKGFVSGYWAPLLHSFPDLERQSHLFYGGKSSGRIDGLRDGHMWVCGTGFLKGTFAHDYLTIPASGKRVSIRWGEFCRIEQGRIVEIHCLLDLIDLMEQAGFQVLPSSRGEAGVYPPPRAEDGVILEERPESETARSLEHIRQFLFDGLNSYDSSDLKSMGMADYFHPEVQWYGPGGIGACLSLQDFQSRHQQPWLHAFANRRVQNLDSLFAEGCYTGSSAWKGVIATHTGEYLGCRPTSTQLIEFNGIDYWKRDGEMYVENWVFVDMIHLFRQLGVDLFDRLSGTDD